MKPANDDNPNEGYDVQGHRAMTKDESECWDSAQRWHEKYLKAEADNAMLRTQCGGNCRYWEGRWRDEKTDNDRLRAALRDAHGLIDNDLVVPWIVAHKLDDVLGTNAALKDTTP